MTFSESGISINVCITWPCGAAVSSRPCPASTHSRDRGIPARVGGAAGNEIETRDRERCRVLAYIYLKVQQHLHLWLTNPWGTNSRSKNPWPTILRPCGAWHTLYMRINYAEYISYEILKYRRKRNACNIYAGEILKYRRKRST